MKLTNPFINQRNKQIWQQSQQKQETLLIGFLLAGDPSPKESLQTIKQAFIAGMDILELGIPSEKPKLDGEVIQRGHARVLKTQTGTDWLVDYCTRLRAQTEQPIWAMGYRTELYQTDLYRLLAEKKLIDALLIPDCSLAEQKQIAEVVQPLGVDVARFVHNSMTDAEMRTICQDANFIYAQSYPGKTGQADIDFEQLAALYGRMDKHTTNAFRMVGFGIGSPEKVKKAVEIGFQGVVVGSAFVAQVEQKAYQSFFRLIAEMKKATRRKK